MSSTDAILNWSLYAITDREMAGGRTHAEIGEALIEGGARVLQVRDKATPYPELLKDTRQLVELARPRAVSIIVNDNPYLARDADTDGVHLGQTDCPVAIARDIVGPDRIIGLSTHNPVQALRAQEKAEVDYIGLGPIFPTDTKQQPYKPLGLNAIRWASLTLRIPFVAIGGIDADRMVDCIAAGARCCAIVSALMKSDDIAATAHRLVQLCEQLSRDDEIE